MDGYADFSDERNFTPENRLDTRKTKNQRMKKPKKLPSTPAPRDGKTTTTTAQGNSTGGQQQLPTLPQAGTAQPTVVAPLPGPNVVNQPPHAQPHPPANHAGQAQPAQAQTQQTYGQTGPAQHANHLVQVPPPVISYGAEHLQLVPRQIPYIVHDVHDRPVHAMWAYLHRGQPVFVPLPSETLLANYNHPIYPYRVQIHSGNTSQDLAQPDTNDDDAAPVASGSGSGSVSEHDHVPADVAPAAPLSIPSSRDDSPASPVVTAADHEAGPSDDVSDLQQVHRADEMVHDEEDEVSVASDSGHCSAYESENVHSDVAPAGLATASSPHGDYAALAFDDIYEVMPSVEQQEAQCEDEFHQLFDWDKYARDTAGPAQPAREPLLPAAPETTAVIEPTVLQALFTAPAVEINAQTAPVGTAVQPTTRSRVRRRSDDDDDEEEAEERETQAKRVKLTFAGPVDSENVQEANTADRAVSQALDEASNTAEAHDVPSQPVLDKNTSGDSEKKIDAKADATAGAKATEKATTEKAAQVENVVSSAVVAPEAEAKVNAEVVKNNDTAKADVEKKSSDTADTPSDKAPDQPASEPAHAETPLPEHKATTAVGAPSDKENDTHDVADSDASKSDADLDKDKTPRKAAKKPNSVRREGAMPLSPRKQTTPRK